MLLQLIVVVPVVAFFLENEKTPVYEASAEVLLNRQNIGRTISGIDDPTIWQPERVMKTQARLARVPEVARRVVRAANVPNLTAWEFLAASSVSSDDSSDLLAFRVRDEDPRVAARLANTYARQYIAYRTHIETLAVRRALEGLERQLAEARSAEQPDSATIGTLVEKQQQLETAEAVQNSTAFLVRTAGGAPQVAPNPTRAAVLGLGIAVVLGLGLAFLWEALDQRVRSPEELAETLGLPMLAKLPLERRGSKVTSAPLLLSAPDSPAAEDYRMLRTNLEFVSIEPEIQVLMVTSAVSSEGKSTTAANLAVALARAGRRAVLIDLDLRRPSLHRYFSLPASPGLTQLVLGDVAPNAALKRVPLGTRMLESAASVVGEATPRTNGRASAGRLDVLPSGPLPPNPGEFVATGAVAELMRKLRSDYDVVIVDGPPILLAGDALNLAAHVDGILVVARLDLARRPLMRDLRRALDAAPATKVGLVVTGTSSEARRRHDYYDYHHPKGERARQMAS